MSALIRLSTVGTLLAAVAIPVAAQEARPTPAPSPAPVAVTADSTAKRVTPSMLVPNSEIQHLRPADQRGINVFEPPKETDVPYTGFKLNWGAAFTQQFQSLDHENSADPRVVGEIDRNRLVPIGNGFNNATANLSLNAQIAPGIRVALTSYLSSRHHNETWVKDGYLLIDASPIDNVLLNTLMEYTTVRAGHFEINYGDAHFRRTDNGNSMYNPFVGNLIMDAFTTQIGGEVYLRRNGLLAMGAITGGEIRGQVRSPANRSPAFYGKVGVDRQVSEHLRVRLTGSGFGQARAANQTLYSGDRAGSRYYSVMDSTQSSETAQFTSGMVNPGFNKVRAFMINPFVKFHGLELFGTIEQAQGRTQAETAERKWNQYAGEVVYRFLPGEKLFVGGRYNTVTGRLANLADDITMERTQIGAGWFITPIILMKGEYVVQRYNDFPTTDIRNGGKFNGFVVEGVIAF